MSKSEASPSAPADPRADWLAITKLGIGGGDLWKPERGTFCSCCGSGYVVVSEDKTTVSMGAGTSVPLDDEGLLRFLSKIHGDRVEERFTKEEIEQTLNLYRRVDRWGVYCINLPLNKALDLLYKKHRAMADGYEIVDADHGTLSVVWLNDDGKGIEP